MPSISGWTKHQQHQLLFSFGWWHGLLMLGPTADAGHLWALKKELVLDAWSKVPSVEAPERCDGDDAGLHVAKKGWGADADDAGPVWGLEKKLVLLTLGPTPAAFQFRLVARLGPSVSGTSFFSRPQTGQHGPATSVAPDGPSMTQHHQHQLPTLSREPRIISITLKRFHWQYTVPRFCWPRCLTS